MILTLVTLKVTYIVYMESNNTIYLWLGSGTSINYSMALLITTNTNEKYLLVVEKPAQ